VTHGIGSVTETCALYSSNDDDDVSQLAARGFDADWQVLTGSLDEQVSQDWMVVMDAKDLEVSLALRVKMEYLAEKALQDDQVRN